MELPPESTICRNSDTLNAHALEDMRTWVIAGILVERKRAQRIPRFYNLRPVASTSPSEQEITYATRKIAMT